MITELHISNWKSFGEETTLYIAPLTFVIGANASGKSNILDALASGSIRTKGGALRIAVFVDTPLFPIQIANDNNGRRLDDGPNALPKFGA